MSVTNANNMFFRQDTRQLKKHQGRGKSFNNRQPLRFMQRSPFANTTSLRPRRSPGTQFNQSRQIWRTGSMQPFLSIFPNNDKLLSRSNELVRPIRHICVNERLEPGRPFFFSAVCISDMQFANAVINFKAGRNALASRIEVGAHAMFSNGRHCFA